MKAAVLERAMGDTTKEKAILDQALQSYPQSDKLWMMRGQLESRAQRPTAALEIFTQGLKNCPKSDALWLCAAAAEPIIGKRRALLESARAKIKGSPGLWRAAVLCELDAGQLKAAHFVLSKGLQECPKAGALWSLLIEMEPAATRRAKAIEAVQRCENDARVIATVALTFWLERKVDKARAWFQRAATLDPDLGDTYAAWLAFERQYGGPEKAGEVVAKCVAAEPRHGTLWVAVSKDPKWKRTPPTEEILELVVGLVRPVGSIADHLHI